MIDISDMLMASFLKIWHLIPIIILIILFKKFMMNKDKKLRIVKNIENKKNGLTLELRTKKKYEKLAYMVQENKTKDSTEDQGIDFTCYKENKVLIIKCNNNSKPKTITEKDIKEFYNNAMKYIKTNDIKQEDVEFRYVIPYSDVLHKSAIKILKDDSYNCKYVLI